MALIMIVSSRQENSLTQRRRGTEKHRGQRSRFLSVFLAQPFSVLLCASVPLCRSLVVALLALLVIARPALAQEGNSVPAATAQMPGVTARFTVEQKPVTVGDPVQLTLEVIHPADTVAIIPAPPATWGDFELRGETEAAVAANPDGTLTTRRTFDVALFAPGTFQTPALPITITTVAGEVGAAVAPPVAVTVDSVLTEADTDLRDLKPQADLALPFPWPAAALIVLALALAVALFVRQRRRSLRARPDTRSPRQRALDELTAVARTNWVGLNMVQEHYTGISDAVRRYLEGEFAVKVFDRTTAETKALLRRLPLAPETCRQLTGLLGECDLVKFANVTPPPGDCAACLQAAYVLVEKMADEKAAADAAHAAAIAAAMQEQGRRKTPARAG